MLQLQKYIGFTTLGISSPMPKKLRVPTLEAAYMDFQPQYVQTSESASHPCRSCLSLPVSALLHTSFNPVIAISDVPTDVHFLHASQTDDTLADGRVDVCFKTP